MSVNKMKKPSVDINVDDHFDDSLGYMKNAMMTRSKQDYMHNVSAIRKESLISLGVISCIVFLEGVVYAVASFLWM